MIKGDRIAPPGRPRRNDHGGLPVEQHRPVSPRQNRAACGVKAHMHIAQGEGARAQGIAEPQAQMGTPERRPQHQAEALVAGAARGIREHAIEIGLSGGFSGGIGPLVGARPNRGPGHGVIVLMRGHRIPPLFGHDYAMGDPTAQEAAPKTRPYSQIRKSLQDGQK